MSVALVTLTGGLEVGVVNVGTPAEPSRHTMEDSGALVNSEAKTGYFESLRASRGDVGMMIIVNWQ